MNKPEMNVVRFEADDIMTASGRNEHFESTVYLAPHLLITEEDGAYKYVAYRFFGPNNDNFHQIYTDYPDVVSGELTISGSNGTFKNDLIHIGDAGATGIVNGLQSGWFIQQSRTDNDGNVTFDYYYCDMSHDFN